MKKLYMLIFLCPLQVAGGAGMATEKAALTIGQVFRDCAQCPQMVVFPAGSFSMGSHPYEEGRYENEGPVRRVTIAQPFAVGVYEVTVDEYARFASATGRLYRGGNDWRNPGFIQGYDYPVTHVNWHDAQAYVTWLSRETGKDYRLLSESEWEYMARAGTIASRYWGDSESGQCRHANGADKEAKKYYGDWTIADCNDGYMKTAPVGSYRANMHGVHDALGNVWEWVQDCWNDSYLAAPSDGRAWELGDCSQRVLRGGSWVNEPRLVRSAYRKKKTPDNRNSDFGFRVARTLTR